jgi:hypothetical protein
METTGNVSRRSFCKTISARAGILGFVQAALGAGCSHADAEGLPGARMAETETDGNSPGTVQLGVCASLGGKRFFPADNPWNQDISREPADKDSGILIASIGLDKSLHPDFGTVYRGNPIGYPYVVVPGTQPKVPIRFTAYGGESEPGPYPIPLDAPVEGGANSDGDRHVLVLDRDNWKLYELFRSFREGKGWRADSGAVFDLSTNNLRPAGWTSANAAGLPMLPGLVRYDEAVEQEAIQHALAFTCRRSRRAYLDPARHFASKSNDPALPPMGMRVRLKADVDIFKFPVSARVILTALKKYGMLLADNGSDWYINGAHHPRWNDQELSSLKQIKGRDFEVVRMGHVVTG